MQTVSQHKKVAEANEVMMPTDIIVSGPNCSNRLRLRDKENSGMWRPALFLMD
jgi:hypothetical protein